MRRRRADLAREVNELRRRQAGFRALWTDAAHLYELLLGLAERMATGAPGAIEEYRRHFPTNRGSKNG